jgi:hypothetical protein
MSDHAILSPSGASKWMNCTPSARLEDTQPESSSIYADEGTLAHSINEITAQLELKLITKAQYKKKLKEFQAHELYDNEMLECAEDYLSVVMQKLTEARTIDPAAVIYLEKKFDLSKYIPEGYGHVDCPIVADKVLFVIDYKHGKGVPVSSDYNKQMLIYGLGAYLEFCDVFDIEELDLTIVQPRINNTSSFRISVKELLAWADTVLKPTADKAFSGVGEFMPGTHCQFCKVRATCRAHAAMQMELAKHDFAEPVLLNDAEISDILSRKKLFEGWLTAVGDHALYEAVHNGKQWPGYKLVEGRSNRKYSDEDAVLNVLTSNGYQKYDVGKFKLFGITEMEKELTKKIFADLLSPLVIKPAGKPVLAPEDDKREVYNSVQQAQKDFS